MTQTTEYKTFHEFITLESKKKGWTPKNKELYEHLCKLELTDYQKELNSTSPLFKEKSIRGYYNERKVPQKGLDNKKGRNGRIVLAYMCHLFGIIEENEVSNILMQFSSQNRKLYVRDVTDICIILSLRGLIRPEKLFICEEELTLLLDSTDLKKIKPLNGDIETWVADGELRSAETYEKYKEIFISQHSYFLAGLSWLYKEINKWKKNNKKKQNDETWGTNPHKNLKKITVSRQTIINHALSIEYPLEELNIALERAQMPQTSFEEQLEFYSERYLKQSGWNPSKPYIAFNYLSIHQKYSLTLLLAYNFFKYSERFQNLYLLLIKENDLVGSWLLEKQYEWSDILDAFQEDAKDLTEEDLLLIDIEDEILKKNNLIINMATTSRELFDSSKNWGTLYKFHLENKLENMKDRKTKINREEVLSRFYLNSLLFCIWTGHSYMDYSKDQYPKLKSLVKESHLSNQSDLFKIMAADLFGSREHAKNYSIYDYSLENMFQYSVELYLKELEG